ncbi:MAG: GyrI-like domain-containing protein [Lachnospira sp.]
MLKIGEFSKLSHLTVKALRFYEKENLLVPAFIDEWTGYRFYETSQLSEAAKIKAYRQLDLSIDEIKAVYSGTDIKSILSQKAKSLSAQREEIDIRLSIINHILEEKEMKYQITEKTIPSVIVYYAETVLEKYQDIMQWIPSLGEKCMQLNPDIKCAEPAYEFCEYLDGEYKEKDIRIRHNEAVTGRGIEDDDIKFREIPETKVLSIYHKGAYDRIGEAYAYIMKYAEENGYKVAGLARECYIDGIWNKENVEDWLTEIQLPIEG